MIKRHQGLMSFVPMNKGTRYELPGGSMIQRQYGQIKSDGITTIGIPFERYPVGVGYICIPSNIKRNTYITGCMRSGKVGLFTEAGDYLWDTPIDRRVLQEIEFPDRFGELGSVVVFVNMPKHNTPIVVGVLNKNDEFQDYEEHKYKIRKETDTAFAEIVIDGKNGSITTNIQNEDLNNPAVMRTVVGGRDFPAEVLYRIYGQVISFIEGSQTIRASQTLDWIVDDPDIDDKRTVWGYTKGVGFDYLDEFENKLQIVDQQMMFDSPEILHGENATEPAVLGDTLEDLLGQLIDAINQITVTTPVGPSGPPINIPVFVALKEQLITFKSTKNKIE